MTDIVSSHTEPCPPWMHIAKLFEGESEIPGALHNDKIIEMFRLIEHPEFQSDETPWCAAAVGACLSLSGFKNTRSALARSYERFGEELGNIPRYGCIVVFWRGSQSSTMGHVGFYCGEKDGKILVLGGNQKNSFTIDAYSKKQFLSCRWPVVTGELPDSFLPTILDLNPNEAPAHLRLAVSTITPIRSPAPPLSANFLKCHDIIAKWEGGYSDHPRDPGGATNFGITLKTLSSWRGKAVSKNDVRALTYAEALEIFAAKYWTVISGNALPLPAALMTYNAAVNAGPAVGVRLLQKALNRQGANLFVDGEVGPLTIDQSRIAQLDLLVNDYAQLLEAYYEGLGSFDLFGRGWLNRLRDVREKALAWLSDAPKPDEVNQLSEDGDLTNIDKALGGKALRGKKTLIATLLYILIVLAQGFGLLDGTILDGFQLPSASPVSPPESEGYSQSVQPTEVLKTILLSLAGLGALSKVERGLKNVRKLSRT